VAGIDVYSLAEVPAPPREATAFPYGPLLVNLLEFVNLVDRRDAHIRQAICRDYGFIHFHKNIFQDVLVRRADARVPKEQSESSKVLAWPFPADGC
jgi:hypothetical protein